MEEGDSTGGPWPARRRNSWPTLVIEAGVSESLSALRDDMRWRFSASDHDVKIVLLTKFDNRNQQLIIERWEEEAQHPSDDTLRPVLQQSIVITRDGDANNRSYHVTSGALELSFRLLFLRDAGPQEGDYTISIPELEGFARRVWAVVEDTE